MFIIKKHSEEYIEDGVFHSCEALYIFGICLYLKTFTTTNATIISQFVESQQDEEESEYKKPVVVNGFIKK